MSRRIRGVGAIIFDGSGRLLVVQRGHAPARGQWTIPGGKVKPGETDVQALEREIWEETGLRIDVGALAGQLQRPGPHGVIYDIADYDASLRDGLPAAATARAADDAADLRWVTLAELLELPLTDGLVDFLREWDRLPIAE